MIFEIELRNIFIGLLSFILGVNTDLDSKHEYTSKSIKMEQKIDRILSDLGVNWSLISVF